MANVATDRSKVKVEDHYFVYKDIDTNRVAREIVKYGPLIFSKEICILREFLTVAEV